MRAEGRETVTDTVRCMSWRGGPRQVKRDTPFVALTSGQQPPTPMLSTIAMAQAAEQQTRRCQFAAHGMQGEACLLFPAIALKSPWGRACCARPHGLHRVMSLVVGADGGPCGCGRCWSCGKVVKTYLGGRDHTLTHSKLLQRVSVLQQTSANFSRHALRSCPNANTM